VGFKSDDDKKAYWRANLHLLFKLLSIWFLVSFGCGILLVDVLNQVQFFGFKLGFWFAQQGAIYVFVGLIFYYMYKMNQLDKRFGVDEE
jgi:putative solute:sodium symporter small subunit